MPITGCAEPEIQRFHRFASLPEDALALCDSAGDLFGSSVWWRVVEAHALPATADPVFLAARVGGRCVGLLALLRVGRRLSGLTTPYTCRFMPALAEGLSPGRLVSVLMACLAACRRQAVIRLDCLPEEWDGLPDLCRAAAAMGLRTIRFEHFGNWHEPVAGLDWADYLRQRQGALRETVRRRLRKAEALAGARFDLFREPEDMDQAVAAYESVYRRSWKEPEPYPAFNAALMRAVAETGWLRLGVWSIGGEPVAVQFWVVRDGRAIVLKLAHDEAFKAHSPGTVLTALMLRHLLDREHVSEIDFGRGDDSYKQGWARSRRARIGLLLVDPCRAAGIAVLLRHAAGRVLRGGQARLRRRMLARPASPAPRMAIVAGSGTFAVSR